MYMYLTCTERMQLANTDRVQMLTLPEHSSGISLRKEGLMCLVSDGTTD